MTRIDELKPYCTDRQWEYLELKHTGLSNTGVADKLGIDRRAVDRGIQAVYTKATKDGQILDTPSDLKILYLDIETSPVSALVWSMFSEVRSIDFIEQDSYVMGYAYKWHGNSEVYGKTLNKCAGYTPGSEDDVELILDLWSLLDQADIVIAHNGDNFDLKRIRASMVTHGMLPPSPYRTIDTLKICRREFKFLSNKLDYIGQKLCGITKVATGGIDLWKGCILGKEEMWDLMLEYNAWDVEMLEQVYLKIRPWDRSHPNVALLSNLAEPTCTVCASTDISESGSPVYTPSSKFTGYVCNSCGHNMRGRTNILAKEQKENVLINAR